MNSVPSFSPSPSNPKRSSFVKMLAWAFIVVGGLLTPISAISSMMLATKSYGSNSATLTGFFSVVVAPPLALVAGIGMLRRKRSAWFCAIGLLAFIALVNAVDLLRPSPPKEVISSTGVTTTTITSGTNFYTLPFVVLCVIAITKLLSPTVREEFGILRATEPRPEFPVGAESRNFTPANDPNRDWRVGHQGRDRMYYEEKHLGTWRRIDIEGEMLMGPAHHAIYFASPERWQSYPDWARNRRDEIISRIKSEFHPPDYEYHGETGALPAQSAEKNPRASSTKATPKQIAVLWLCIVLLLGITAGMGWLVKVGFERNYTYVPSKHSSRQRTVSREADPVMFWVSLSLYSAIGLGTTGLALWGIRESFRLNR